MPPTDPFEFDHRGTTIVFGRDCVGRLDDVLAEQGLGRALVVCGSNVGANPDVMDPVTEALGDRLAGVFDETSSAKSIRTVYDGIERMERDEVDVLVAVGAGSSITVARLMSGLQADGRSLSELRDEVNERGDVASPVLGDSSVPIVTIPTTFAGADLTTGSSTRVFDDPDRPFDQACRVRVSDAKALPHATLYDPNLFSTTPTAILARSAMNGFDKGIETVYSRHATPLTDSTATYGLSLLRSSLPDVAEGDTSLPLERALVGTILVQFERKTSIIHAFGHGISRRYDVQQGVVHGIVAPHVLRYVLDAGHGRRRLLAEGLGIDADSRDDDAVADSIVSAVVDVRDALGIPTRLREIDELNRDAFPSIARYIVDDTPMRNAPDGLDPTTADVRAILDDAW
jgi:alcohol dehydrogenase class IV